MNNLIAVQTREIRVFLSSTFRDMDAERTHLVKQVFPKVRAACLERQVGFSEIDLRWGVSEEESKNGATVEICLKEIERCRDFPPFFVGFLGERYGWVPKHDELSAYWDTHSDSQYAVAIRDSIKRGISVTELEMELAVLGVGAAEKIANHALFCLRDAGLTNALYLESKAAHSNTCEADFFDAGNGKLDAIKQQIRKSGFLGLDNYSSVDQFGCAVESYLLAQLDLYFPTAEVPTILERGNAAHAGFRFQRLQNFLPRTDVREQMIAAIEQRIESPFLGTILVTGPSGQGKSALMADLARHYQTEFAKDWRVIDHYIGADNANYIEGWVDRILQTLHPEIKDIAGDMPESPKDKIEALSTWISMAARRNNCRYLFILDALDQLSDGGKSLDILTPEILGPDGILIASAADDTLAYASTANWKAIITVPPLTNELRTQMISETLARYRKSLPEALLHRLATAPQSGSPLFLSLALEELRLDARHETLVPITDEILKQPDAEQLFLNRFLLDADNGRPELPELAASFMALLGASRAGLSENELADLLAQPDDPIAEDTGKPRLPQIYLSRLLNNLAPFLLNKEGRRAPMHRIFGEAALNYFGILKIAHHHEQQVETKNSFTSMVRMYLYSYFEYGYGRDGTEYNCMAAVEALYQITKLAMIEQDALQYDNNRQFYIFRLLAGIPDKLLSARKQLVSDLGLLSLPVNLRADEEADVVFEALQTLHGAEQADLHKQWLTAVPNLMEIQPSAGRHVGRFIEWIERKFGHSKSLIEIKRSILENSKRILGDEHIDTTYAIGQVAGSLYRAELHQDRDIQTALELDKQVLEIRIRTLGEDDPDTLVAMLNLSVSLQAQGDRAEARKLKERVFESYRRIYGDNDEGTLLAMNNLVSVLDGDETLQLRKNTLELCLASLGESHDLTCRVMRALAGELQMEGDLQGSRELFEKTLAVRLRNFDPKHITTWEVRIELISVLEQQGDLLAVKAIQEQILSQYGDVCGGGDFEELQWGKNSFNGLSAKENLAVTIGKLGDFDHARTMFEEILSVEDHSGRFSTMCKLGRVLYAQGNLTRASEIQGKSLDGLGRTLGDEAPETITAMYGLVKTLSDQGDLHNEKIIRERLLKALRITEGEDDRYTLSQIDKLAVLLGKLGDLDGERALEEQLLDARRRTLGDEHPDTISAMSWLAGTLDKLGQYSDAQALYEKMLEIQRKQEGEEHPDTIQTKSNLAAMLGAQGELTAARDIQEKILENCQRVLGEEDSLTVAAKHNLSITLNNLKEKDSAANMRISSVITQWLEELEWEERPEINEEKRTSSTGFVYQVTDDFSVKCYLDASEHQGYIKLYMYFLDTKVPESKIKEATRFVNMANVGMDVGHLVVIPDNRCLRYDAGIDVEGATIEPRHISNLLNAGLHTMEKRLPQMMAICFRGKSAEEAFEFMIE